MAKSATSILSSRTSPGHWRPEPLRGKDGERGVALLVVIMVVLMVSFLASELIMQVRAELRIAANGKSRTVSAFLAEAGVNASLFRLVDKPLTTETGEDEPFLEGSLYEAELPTGTMRYLAVSEAGKIDLNAAPPELLKLFFEDQGLDEEQIETLVDSLQDWRDVDDLHRMNGAESEYYQELDDPYVARNGAIEDPSELLLVRGADALPDRLAPEEVFTVHNNATGKINFNSLTPAMLDFLAGGDPDRKESYREAQELYGTLNQAHAMEILGEERYSLVQSFLSYESRPQAFGQNSYYSIEATGLAGADAEEGEEGEEGEEKQGRPGIRTRTLVRVEGSTVHYLSWREEYI